MDTNIYGYKHYHRYILVKNKKVSFKSYVEILYSPQNGCGRPEHRVSFQEHDQFMKVITEYTFLYLWPLFSANRSMQARRWLLVLYHWDNTETQEQPPGFYEEDIKVWTSCVIDYSRAERVNNWGPVSIRNSGIQGLTSQIL